MSQNFTPKAKFLLRPEEHPVEVNLPQPYLDNNMIAIPELTNNSSVIKQMPAQSRFVVHCTHYINKAIDMPKK
jgi:hypothetical protein